jgi:hypothetical protein
MPAAVFHYIEREEDHEDWGTWKPSKELTAMPVLPGWGGAPRAGGGIGGCGWLRMFAGPYPGRAMEYLRFGEFPVTPELALGSEEAEILELDFAAMAESSTPRWRFSLKKTAGIFG